jgi:hypothetical protein
MIYNCDEDEFSDAYLTTVDGDTVKTIRVADDSNDQYSEEMQRRMKGK